MRPPGAGYVGTDPTMTPENTTTESENSADDQDTASIGDAMGGSDTSSGEAVSLSQSESDTESTLANGTVVGRPADDPYIDSQGAAVADAPPEIPEDLAWDDLDDDEKARYAGSRPATESDAAEIVVEPRSADEVDWVALWNSVGATASEDLCAVLSTAQVQLLCETYHISASPSRMSYPDALAPVFTPCGAFAGFIIAGREPEADRYVVGREP